MKTKTLTLAAAITATLPLSATAAQQPPNIILILADDLGWSDLSCTGSDFYQTPHIDSLARDGTTFTNAYAACTVCSPSRAAILTGLYPARLHLTNWIPGRLAPNPKLLIPKWTKHLPLERTTIAEILKPLGYTTASIGKWHLGLEPYFPTKQGFDINIAGTEGGAPKTGYFSPYNMQNITDGPPGEYLTTRIGNEAVRFIEQNHQKPFFLYFPHFAVHTPLQAPKHLVEKYKKILKDKPGTRHKNPTYAAMIETMDDTVGEIRQTLKKLNIDQNTLIIFTSDNGGLSKVTTNAPLRAGKGSAFEGGTRVPLIIYWPGKTKPGSSTDTRVIGTDLFNTITEIAGTPATPTPDGLSLTPLLTNTGNLTNRALYWHYPHYQLYMEPSGKPHSIILSQNHRLIEYHDGTPTELYDLSKDPSETQNLAPQNPTLAAKLLQQLHAWRLSVGAQMPAKNPNYDPTQPEQPKGKGTPLTDTYD